FYSKNINQASLVMVRLNETLLSENNNLRKDIENLTALRKNDEKAVAEVIEENLLEEREKTAAEPEKKMIISDELITRLSTQILEIMNDKHSVFNPDYSISMLALQLNTNTRYISEVIRHLGASNFRNFINEYRIREACRRLSDKEKYGKFTIGAIAESVGFNSDNSFIIAFKKVMGMTPAKYRRLASDVHKENNFQGNLDNL
ncbi:MAG: AraC family transcriptional regulator, partial [Muribaculaceae bacterium]|nr:AraC family transcriptional regulator [Muribaculaceae bacterium]